MNMIRPKGKGTGTDVPRNWILVGDCMAELAKLPAGCADMVFADPPYNLQLKGELFRPNQTRVDAVDDAWDKFADFAAYDRFGEAWLAACRRVLKDTGTIWVIGSYHNIHRLGRIMMDLGFWLLNDVTWVKSNPMPNFRGTRFTNATETLIWAKRSEDQRRYTFHHHAMRALNDEKQMRSDWQIPICSGEERLRAGGRKAHSTQKPEALLHRVILSSTDPGDLVLDPFLGSGTTAAVAKRLGRDYIGIESDATYAEIAAVRVAATEPAPPDEALLRTPSKRDAPRLPFGALVESGAVGIGETLWAKNRRHRAKVKADSRLQVDGQAGSIHAMGAMVQRVKACNGWDFWHVERKGRLVPLDSLRERHRKAAGGRSRSE